MFLRFSYDFLFKRWSLFFAPLGVPPGGLRPPYLAGLNPEWLTSEWVLVLVLVVLVVVLVVLAVVSS